MRAARSTTRRVRAQGPGVPAPCSLLCDCGCGAAPRHVGRHVSPHPFLCLRLCPTHPAGAPAHLGDLMARVDGAKQRSIIQHMSKDLIPIMEKGLVDCPLVHRCARCAALGYCIHWPAPWCTGATDAVRALILPLRASAGLVLWFVS